MRTAQSFLVIFATIVLVYFDIEPVQCEFANNEVFTDLKPGKKDVIEKVRSLVGDGLYRDYMRTDKYLVRWVRDANLSAPVAAEKIRKFHDYRIKNQIDTILSENWKSMEYLFPFEIINGVDIEGSAIVFLQVGKWNIRKQVIGGGSEKFRRYVDYALEKIDVAVRNTKAVNGSSVLDMSGYSLKTTGCLACIPELLYYVNTLEHHYPQLVKHMYMINTPRYVDPVLKLAMPILSPYTKKVIHVYGYDKSEWFPVLLSKIPANLLTEQYGGTRKF